MTNIEYGIVCQLTDEKKLVKNINDFLQRQDFRKLYKWPDRSIRPADKSFDMGHYYAQFLKETPGWHFELMPNIDKSGRVRFEEALDCGWTLFTAPFRDDDPSLGFSATNEFFDALIVALGFPTKPLRTYQRGESRQ